MRTVEEELAYERDLISRQEESYLASNVLEKVARDPGYRAKVDRIAQLVAEVNGPILDIGSNTCGEAEYLAHCGHTIVATDINTLALSISRRRCANQHRKAPEYVCCSGQLLPFAATAFDAVTFIESLHHMPRPDVALAEAFRVLRPGGLVVGLEPCSLDPWRRISEIRDFFKGSIETSFSVSELRSKCEGLGFVEFGVTRFVDPPSVTKMESLHLGRRILRKTYYRLRRATVQTFGMIHFYARKPGLFTESTGWKLSDVLRCPLTGAALLSAGEKLVSTDGTTSYEMREGIPQLTLEQLH